MRLSLFLLLLVVSLPAASQSRLAPEAAARLQGGLTATADGFIAPATAAQAEAAARMAAALERYCVGAEGIGPAHDAFAETFLAWQRASLVQVGPILEAEGPMRVQLWPDPKGFARRAIRAALSGEDPELVAPGGLAGRSVALSSLTALERLLHAPLPPGSYACDLARAIARQQAKLAADLAAAWRPGHPFRTAYDTAAAGNARYPGIEPLIRELLAGLVVHVDRLRKFKIERGLGAAPGAARPERTEARASGLGLASMEASFRGLADLYDVPFGLFDTASELGGAMDYVTLAQTNASVADALAFRDGTLAQIAERDGAAAAELRGYGDIVLLNERYLKTGFPASIGLTSGFTAADGD